MIPIFKHFLNKLRDKAGIASPSLQFATAGAFLFRGFVCGEMSETYKRVTRYKQPYTLPYVVASWGLEYAPLSAAVCRYDNTRFYHTDETVSVLKGVKNSAE